MVRSGAFKVRARMRPALSSRIESFEGFGGDDACMDLAVGCHITPAVQLVSHCLLFCHN